MPASILPMNSTRSAKRLLDRLPRTTATPTAPESIPDKPIRFPSVGQPRTYIGSILYLESKDMRQQNRFLLYLEFETARFTLKRDGESWVKEFPSLLDALQHARSVAPNTDTRLTVFDETGRAIIDTFV